MSRRVRLFGLAVLLAALCLTATLLLVRADPAGSPGLSFWLAVAVIAAGQFARIQIRLRAEYVLVGWGEVATILALCLVPPMWLPLVALIGMTIGHIDRVVSDPTGNRLRVPYMILALTVSSTVAAAVAALLNQDPAASIHPDTVSGLAVLLTASLVYFLVASVLVAAWVADSRGLSRTWRDIAWGKRFMLPGNLAVGTAVAIVFAIDPRWLVTLIPLVLILRRSYRNQARLDDGSRWWEDLAAATRVLGQPDPPEVGQAAVLGAAALFGVAEAQVTLLPEPSAATGEAKVWYGSGGSVALSSAAVPMTSPRVVARPLVVGDAALGEMRLGLDRAKRIDPTAEMAFSTYATAVAHALSDAANHQHLELMAARSAFDAVHDPLTGLHNRSMLVARGDAELAGRLAGAPAALVQLDVDAFRAVNDTLSPAGGDDLLRLIAARLEEAIRDGEILARLGGDEFALFLAEDDAAPDAATERAKHLAALVGSPVEVAGVTIGITTTVGVGVGCVGDPGDRLDTCELMRRAGAALRLARRSGVALARYTETCAQPRPDRHTVLADLRDALATTNQLTVAAQPVVCLATHVPVGAELLVRWHHPTRGLLLPTAFLDVVEHSELAGGFTMHVLDMALDVAADWSRQGINLPVTVNLCARCTLDPQLPAAVLDRLTAHGVDPRRLILEITEGVMVADPDQVKPAVAAVRELGVQVSVGDFGTASASLDLLARCRVDEVKIDRTFVAAMTTSPETAAIVAATVDIARALNFRVVAEAVELPEQRDALLALGVTMGQGHLFHPPLSPVDLAALLGGSERVPLSTVD
jgi:diguanylate cyclase (GGDEF)-like protein